MTFKLAIELPKSHRPTAEHRWYTCGICQMNGLPAREMRNINRVGGYEHRKRGFACDLCVKRIQDLTDKAGTDGRLF